MLRLVYGRNLPMIALKIPNHPVLPNRKHQVLYYYYDEI